MKHYEWTSKLSIGVQEIDEQHKYLIQILNTLGDKIDIITQEELLDTLLKLQNYAKEHFASEEKLMGKYNYASIPMNAHIAEHEYFIWEIKCLMELHAEANPNAASEIYHFIGKWLVFHIMNIDMLLAQSIKSEDK